MNRGVRNGGTAATLSWPRSVSSTDDRTIPLTPAQERLHAVSRRGSRTRAQADRMEPTAKSLPSHLHMLGLSASILMAICVYSHCACRLFARQTISVDLVPHSCVVLDRACARIHLSEQLPTFVTPPMVAHVRPPMHSLFDGAGDLPPWPARLRSRTGSLCTCMRLYVHIAN